MMIFVSLQKWRMKSMNKAGAVELMINEVLEIEKQEDVNRFKKVNDMKKDAVKKILAKLEEVEIDED